MAAMAEHERKMISQRTKEGLRVAKARGVKLGNPRLNEARACRKSPTDMTMATAVRVKSSIERARKVMKFVNLAKAAGAVTLQNIADYLNFQTEIRTPRGALWSPVAVRRVITKVS